MIPGAAERIFLQAIELPPAERPDYVHLACAGDEPLLREVTSLLEAASGAQAYFADFAGRVGLPALAADEAAVSHADRIGPWRLVEMIGRGGMGAVYLAERADGQYEQRAALKVLPVGARDRLSRERFLAERQILARLVHPNITRLLDGGLTADGTPWFAMDYVEGMPIDEYCDQRRLGVETRLELLLAVCDGVEHAHRGLVIHRDIKPGNVLVDAGGVPRLLDFGIAKLMDIDAGAADLTGLARRPLTPAYASPEMILGQPVDVTADVYSLGVLAYRLLTGHMPLDYRGLSATEVEARAAAVLPRVASAAVLADGRAPDGTAVPAAALAARRGTDPRRLAARLAGDLDAILATALAKERDRRYGSVELFARDLRRHLAGHPVAARPPTLGYRAGRFLRRNLAAVAAAASGVLLLAAVTGLALRHAAVTSAQARVIAAERDRAEEIKGFLQRIFFEVDPTRSKGEELTAREVLERGAARVDAEMAGRPDLRADLLETISEVYQGLGHYGEARPLALAVADYRRETDGEWSEPHAEALEDLALIEEMSGDYPQALERARSSVAIRRALGQPAPLADSLTAEARVLHRLGRLDEAEPLYLEALELLRSVYPGPDEQLAFGIVNLGALKEARGALAEAELLQREALAMRTALEGDDGSSLVESWYNLGSVLQRQARYEEAKAAFERALDIGHKYWPDGHQDQVYMLNGLARVHESLGEWAAAEARYREALTVIRRHLGDGHPNEGVLQYNLGSMWAKAGNCEAARPPLEASIATLSRANPGSGNIAAADLRLGRCLLDADDPAGAERHLSRAFSAERERRGVEHERTQAALAELVRLYEKLGDERRLAELRPLLAAPAGT